MKAWRIQTVRVKDLKRALEMYLGPKKVCLKETLKGTSWVYLKEIQKALLSLKMVVMRERGRLKSMARDSVATMVLWRGKEMNSVPTMAERTLRETNSVRKTVL